MTQQKIKYLLLQETVNRILLHFLKKKIIKLKIKFYIYFLNILKFPGICRNNLFYPKTMEKILDLLLQKLKDKILTNHQKSLQKIVKERASFLHLSDENTYYQYLQNDQKEIAVFYNLAIENLLMAPDLPDTYPSSATEAALNIKKQKPFNKKTTFYENKLRNNMSYYQSILETPHKGIWILDENHFISFVNEKITQILGHTRSEMKGQKLSQFLPKNLIDSFLKESCLQYNIKLKNRNKQDTWIHIASNPIYDKTVYKGTLIIVTDITTQRNTEIELKSQHHFFKKIIDTSPNLIFTKDTQGRFTMVNRAMSNFYAMPVKKLIGKPESEVIKVSVETNTSDKNAQDIFHNCSSSAIWTSAKNEKHYFQTIEIPIYCEGKEQTLGIATDITDIIQAEKALKNSEAKYQLLIENTGLPTMIYDKNATILLLNKNAANLLGNIPSTLIGKTLYDIFPEPQAKEYHQKIRKAIDSQQADTTENQVKTPQNTFWYLTGTQPLIDENKECHVVQVIVQDITKKKQAEEALKYKEEKYSSLVNLSPIGILVHFQDTISFINSTAIQLLGGTRKHDFIHKSIYRFIRESDHQHAQTQTQRVFQDLNPSKTTEEKFVKMNGEIIEVEVIRAPVSFKGQTAIQLIFSDITQRKKTQQELRQLNNELIQKNQKLSIKETELASANDELISNQKDLNKTLQELSTRNFELDQLVYKTSHDLRSPLSSILGLVSLIKNETDHKAISQYVHYIESRIQKLDDFIKSMLNYARANRMDLQIEKIDIEELIQNCIADLEYFENFSRIKTTIVADAPTKIITNDYLRLKIILSNIISNSYKYMNPHVEDNYLNITISPQQKNTRIVLEDNGIGIAREHLEKIFQMFYRATTQSEGSGLGMYIVKQTIEKLKGSIQIESTFGEGTKITILLPELLS